MTESYTAQPRIDERGVPYCAEDDCSAYDGKRCGLLGHRPSTICEPAVVGMAMKLKLLNSLP